MAQQQDYWHGGWANAMPSMADLPGTQAVKMSGGTYGPLQALADMLGAYWMKRSTEGGLGYASGKDFQSELDQMTAPEYEQHAVATPQAAQTRQDAANALTQNGQLASTDFLHRNAPTAPAYGFQAAVNSTPEGQSMLKAMQDFAAANPANQRTAQQQAQDAAFAQQKQEHPEWFAGNTYTGGDENARVKANVDYAKGRQVADQAKSARTGRFDSGMEQYGFTGRSRPLSFDEVRDRATQLKSKAMNEVYKKWGARGAQVAEGMIDDAINKRLGQYGDAVLGQLRAPIESYLAGQGGDLNDNRNFGQLMSFVGNYNVMARKLGQPEYDTKVISQAMKNDQTKFVTQNTGGTINTYVVKQNGRPLGVDKDGKPVYMQPIMKTAVTLSPYQKGQLQLGAQRVAETGRHNRANEAISSARAAETARHNRVTEANASARTQAALEKAASGGGSKQTETAIINGFKDLDIDKAINDESYSGLADLGALIQDAKQKGKIKGAFADEASNMYLAKQFEFEKKQAADEEGSEHEDAAATYASEIAPDWWAEHMAPSYGEQPD